MSPTPPPELMVYRDERVFRIGETAFLNEDDLDYPEIYKVQIIDRDETPDRIAYRFRVKSLVDALDKDNAMQRGHNFQRAKSIFRYDQRGRWSLTSEPAPKVVQRIEKLRAEKTAPTS